MKNLQQSICTVIVAKTLPEFLSLLEKIQKKAHWIELRVDGIQNITLADIEIIRRHTQKKAIFCCRNLQEGGFFSGSRIEQHHMLQKANDLGFDYLDIDLAAADHLQIQDKKAKIIISYHDFNGTPTINQLQTILNQMRIHRPDVFKFATFTKNEQDALQLLRFLLHKEEQENWIILGMGEAGKKVRILAPLLGGYLTFASTPESLSAPGQIDLQLLEDLYRRLEYLL